MTRKWPASTVDRALAGSYFEKAVRFRADAEKMMELADEFSGNGISVLCVHAAIAYGDAIAIFAAGRTQLMSGQLLRARKDILKTGLRPDVRREGPVRPYLWQVPSPAAGPAVISPRGRASQTSFPSRHARVPCGLTMST